MLNDLNDHSCDFPGKSADSNQSDDAGLAKAMQEQGSAAEQYKLQIPAAVENLNHVLAFVDSHLEAADCPFRTQMQLDVAIEEIFVNIASYAYENVCGDAEITMWMEKDPLTAVIEFRDNGIPYDPLAKQDPDVTLSADEREIGGLGIYMVKKSMDDMQYRRENDQNILTLRKKF